MTKQITEVSHATLLPYDQDAIISTPNPLPAGTSFQTFWWVNTMFSKHAPAVGRSYSSQDSQSLKSILDATLQSSYGSRTSFEDITLPSEDTDGSQPLSITNNESDPDSQLSLPTASDRRYCELLPFRVDLLSGGPHGSDSNNSSSSGSFGYRSPDSNAAQLLQMELANAKQLVGELRKRVSQLEKNEVGLKIHIQVLEGKLETSRSMYDSLLERINGLSVNTKINVVPGSHSSRPTFHDLLLELRKRCSDLPPYPRPKGTIYWTREEWHQEHQNGRGTVSVSRRPNESATGQVRHGTSKGSTPFIIGTDSYIVDSARQGQMRDYIQSLWQMLAFFELAPTSWSKATSLATEFVVLSMRLEFEEFRLCDKDWKADAFATRHYPNWKGNPHSAIIKNEVKQEELVSSTQKAVETILNGPLLKRSHTSPTNTVSPRTPSATHRSKKRKDDHMTSEPSAETRTSYSFDEQDLQSTLIDAPIIRGLESSSLAPTSSFLSRAASPLRTARITPSDEKPSPGRNRISIINPLSRWTKGRNSPTDASAPASAGSSTTELTQQLSNTHVTDPNDITVPSTLAGKMVLFQRMSKSFQAVATASSEPKAKGNSSGQQRQTAKGICRTEYMEQNPGKTSSQFEVYWRKLSEEQKKIYTDKFQASKPKSQTKGKGKAVNDTLDNEVLDTNNAAADESTNETSGTV